MNHYYICTGVDLTKKMIMTRKYPDAEAIAGVLECFDPDVAKSAKDIDFEVQSRASHGGALIIKGKNYLWSIFYV